MNYKSLLRNTNFYMLALALILLFSKTGFGQDENNLKNFRFGLKATPSICWFKPDDKKKFESGGAKIKFGYGLITEFRLSNVAVFATGIQVDYDGGKLNFTDSAFYFIYQDEFISQEDTAGKTKDITQYKLNEREYKNTYVTLPLTLKMKTKEIGMLTYFGQFGINTSFRVKSRVDDDVVITKTKGTANQTDLENGKDMNLIKFTLNVGAGAEYNLSGSTSLLFGLNYMNGFSNVLKGESKFLQKGQADKTPLKQRATSNAIALTVGILF